MQRKLSALGVVLIACLVFQTARADVRLAKIFSDNMMFQRDQPIRIWGWAAPGESIKVTFSGQDKTVVADDKGAWLVEFPALKEGEGLELTVAGKNTLVLKNIILGDLWVCGGQSNMEFTLGGAAGAQEEIKNANLPKIRRIKVRHVTSAALEEDLPAEGGWQICSPAVAGSFTAVGFYFAAEIHKQTGIPIGIVDDNWGGTQIEPWTPQDGLDQYPAFKPALADRQKAIATYRAELPKKLDDWEHWIAATRTAIEKNSELPSPPPPLVHPAATGWSSMYNAMIHPLIRMPIKGALWYQGESNGSEGEIYFTRMTALIAGWRKAWGVGDFPFYFVQLANYQGVTEIPAGGDGYARIRWAQTRALSIPNTGMAVIIDIGETSDIHPKDKYDVGMRLSRWALARDYGKKDLEVSGPLYKELKIEGDKVRVVFDHVGAGLMVGTKKGRTPVAEDKDGKLKRFAIAGADKVWQWADATIDGENVILSSPKVPAPVAVRYAFSANPEGANLYNKDGLPASPFRTDEWDPK